MQFPLIEAILVQPEQGQSGKIGICTNTQAPGMVMNEIPLNNRTDIVALGSLVVNRDGTERMIVNCLAHPKIEYLILFGEETISFKPSTNLLLALMKGYDTTKKSNMIIDGKGIAHHYPSIPTQLLEQFKKRIKVIPLYKHTETNTVQEYLRWLEDKINPQLYEKIKKLHEKDKIYYDALQETIDTITKLPSTNTQALQLNPKDFQHLQPPIIELPATKETPTMPFKVEIDNAIKTTINFNGHNAEITGTDSFLIAYSIMDYMNKNNLTLTPEQQLWLGAELSRQEIKHKSQIDTESFVVSEVGVAQHKIPLAQRTILKADTKYYYKISIKKETISVQSLAHDTCENVFELRTTELAPIIKKLNNENRFEEYEQAPLHRMDVGIETARAAIALKNKQQFFQDFRNLFTLNTTHHPLIMVDGDNFLSNHQKIITALYTKGLNQQHPDTHKGPTRTGTILATHRNSALTTMPAIYSSGTHNTTEMREQYKQQLLNPENNGAYTYGNRTRQHFGDQLQNAIDYLRKNPTKPYVIQRFDYQTDMTLTTTEIKQPDGTTRTRIEATHDPCLTHDVYSIINGKLHSLHIARAHNIVNAYPENVFGLYDAYDSTIAKELGLSTGDLHMLSSRGNILLLTEEQKAKRLIAEPVKPTTQTDTTLGPHQIGYGKTKGLGYYETALQEENNKPQHPCLAVLENYKGVNLIEKAINYLKQRNPTHNNPIIGTINPAQYQDDEAHRLAFFQCNQSGQLTTTAVFLNGNDDTLEQDKKLCNYITTQYKKQLNTPLGTLTIIYFPLT